MSKIFNVKGIVMGARDFDGKHTFMIYLTSESAAKLLEPYNILKNSSDAFSNMKPSVEPIDVSKMKLEDFDLSKYTYQLKCKNTPEWIKYQDATGKTLTLDDIMSGDEVIIRVVAKQTQGKGSSQTYYTSYVHRVVKVAHKKFSRTAFSKVELEEADSELEAMLNDAEVNLEDEGLELE